VVKGQREMEVIDPFGNRLCFVEEAKGEGPLRGLKT
jgi:hypothetical protein